MNDEPPAELTDIVIELHGSWDDDRPSLGRVPGHPAECHCMRCYYDDEPDYDDEPPPDVGPPGSGAIIVEYSGNEPGLEDGW